MADLDQYYPNRVPYSEGAWNDAYFNEWLSQNDRARTQRPLEDKFLEINSKLAELNLTAAQKQSVINSALADNFSREIDDYLIPYRQASYGAATQDVGDQAAIRGAQRDIQLSDLNLAAPVARDFFSSAYDINPEQRATEAAADVAHSAAQVERGTETAARRAGLSLRDSQFANIIGDIKEGKIREMAGAKNKARNDARTEQFNRLGSAMNVRGQLLNPAGLGPATPPDTPTANINATGGGSTGGGVSSGGVSGSPIVRPTEKAVSQPSGGDYVKAIGANALNSFAAGAASGVGESFSNWLGNGLFKPKASGGWF